MSDPDYMKALRGTADMIYPQSARTELYEDAPTWPEDQGWCHAFLPSTEGSSPRSSRAGLMTAST